MRIDFKTGAVAAPLAGAWRFLPEAALALAGLWCFAAGGNSWWRYHDFQARSLAVGASGLPAVAVRQDSEPRSIGVLKIARIGLAAAMVEGVEEDSLALGVGHLRESATIGSLGNTVLAGHRDTSFWPLRRLRRGDRIELRTDHRYTYVVQQMTVVRPDDVALLQPTNTAVLTLVTCYPFRHVGPAPRRFMVRASLVPPA